MARNRFRPAKISEEEAMNIFRFGLSLIAVAWLVLTAAAAPVPPHVPESEGPITDFLRQRDRLPATAPPRVLQLRGDGTRFEIERMVTKYVAQTRAVEVEEAGRKKTVYSTVSIPVVTMYKQAVAMKDCKIFTVASGGKLEAVELKKVERLLRKPTAVLVGDSPTVEPRHLELVQSGTLYLVLPPAPATPVMPPDAPPIPKERE
jgi:hypothetical protein